jgi:hypothetical protein
MLLLDESSVLRFASDIATAIKCIGYALVVALTYLGLRLLWRPVRRADYSLDWGTTLMRWVTGVLLLLPASWLLLLLVERIVEEQRTTRALQARYRAQREQMVANFHLESAGSSPQMRDYAFDLSLRADSTFHVATNIPGYQIDSVGRWRLVDKHDGKLLVQLRHPPKFEFQLTTDDLDSASYLTFYLTYDPLAYQAYYTVRLRKRSAPVVRSAMP